VVFENVIFLVGVYSPVWWGSTPNYWSVIILYWSERISEFTEADQTITVSVVASEEKLNLIARHNKPDVAKPISEFKKTHKAGFLSVKHSEGITNIEVRFDNDVVPWVFYIALNLDCFQEEVDCLYHCLFLKCVAKSLVFAFVGLWHILERLGVSVLLADYLKRLRINWFLDFFCRH
jgi:hypothetical protein